MVGLPTTWQDPKSHDRVEDEEGGEEGPEADNIYGRIPGKLVPPKLEANDCFRADDRQSHPQLSTQLLALSKKYEKMI